ncbi:MAG TPA: cyclic nucleotide-binding domain-containing protein [Chthoniobacteraceae bacterium]|jgi:ferredoxin|nr:cyclic nucleotide-binding domain-containing protein [Chthoniobacteraceae bacterium]
MPMIQDLVAGPNVRDDDEGLFSRDIDGQLVRLDAPTESDYTKEVTLQIDGQEVTVPLAVPLADANGNIVVDIEGRTTPRYITILDAAQKLYVKEFGDEQKIPIPVLCHQSHMTPVAVCRMCVVQIYGQKRGKRAAERKLLPACQHPVKNGMEVFTMKAEGRDGDKVRQTVRVMTEFLAADHLKPVEDPELSREITPFNELGQLTERVGADATRYQLDVFTQPLNPPPEPKPLAGRRKLDASSPVFLVDHSACILCERCIRACDDVQENHVIGRTGKGANAGIGFDLNDAMGKSSCVKCGECMVSCPTSAITFKPVGQIKLKSEDRSATIVPASELLTDPVFAGVPPKFLLWQKGLVIKRKTSKGQVLCRQGDAGNTAFIIKRGRLEVAVYRQPKDSEGVFGKLFSGRGKLIFRDELAPEAVLVGEMACLTGTPRSANVTALEEGEVWEVRRNVLDRLMRLPAQRARFEKEYRRRSLDLVLQSTELFKEMTEGEYKPILDKLRERLTFVRVKPGQTVFEQDDKVNDLYLVRLGHVRISVFRHGAEAKVLSAGPGAIIGEVGLLAFSQADAHRPVDEVDRGLVAALDSMQGNYANYPAGTRSATVSALGHLELARLSREDFLQLVHQFPVLRRRLVEQSLARLRSDTKTQRFLDEFVNQGLYEGRSILTLDTDLCTRCDECTKACVQQHGTESHGLPITRMLRDGLRFDHYLIATACRSCVDPHCMFGCPVDSIHRGKHLQIVIEDHCIGCGLCAENCPYGNIFMVPNEKGRIAMPDPDIPNKTHLVARPKAVTCDLCDAEGERETPKPRCVAACPHDAAHRMTGEELLVKVLEKNQRKAKPWQA